MWCIHICSRTLNSSWPNLLGLIRVYHLTPLTLLWYLVVCIDWMLCRLHLSVCLSVCVYQSCLKSCGTWCFILASLSVAQWVLYWSSCSLHRGPCSPWLYCLSWRVCQRSYIHSVSTGWFSVSFSNCLHISLGAMWTGDSPLSQRSAIAKVAIAM